MRRRNEPTKLHFNAMAQEYIIMARHSRPVVVLETAWPRAEIICGVIVWTFVVN